MNPGEKFRELLEIAKNFAEKDRRQQAAEKLQEARQITTKRGASSYANKCRRRRTRFSASSEQFGTKPKTSDTSGN